MMQILVVCVAGASSTFLARRLTDLASAQGLAWSFTPAPVDSISDDSAAVVAISSHVATPDVVNSFTSRGIRHVLLPDTVRGGFGAEDALTTIVNFANDGFGLSESVDHSRAAKGAI